MPKCTESTFCVHREACYWSRVNSNIFLAYGIRPKRGNDVLTAFSSFMDELLHYIKSMASLTDDTGIILIPEISPSPSILERGTMQWVNPSFPAS